MSWEDSRDIPEEHRRLHFHFKRVFSGISREPSIMGPLYPYYYHTTNIRMPKYMEMVLE